MILLLKIFLLLLLADFVTGLFHFYVDRYALMDSKYLTMSINGLLVHHDDPLKMLSLSYWQLTKGIYQIGGIIFLFSLIFGFHWEVLLFVLFSAQVNVIHKWSHMQRKDLPILAIILQKSYLIQRKTHHMKHHRNQFEGYYCIMTNFVNPIMDVIRGWDIISWGIGLFGIKPIRRDQDNWSGN